MVRKAKAGRRVFELDINRKITNIIGKYGSGKTLLIRSVLNQNTAERAAFLNEFGEPLLLGQGVSVPLALSGLRDWVKYGICIIDCDIFDLGDFSALINESRIPFILLSREVVEDIAVHYDAVYTLDFENGMWCTKRVYTPELGLRYNIPTVVEDSEIGFRFYQRMLGHIGVKTARGFGNIPDMVNAILTSTNHEVQVIADAATFGCCCGDIKDLSRVICFLPECFEEVLANSEVFSNGTLKVLKTDYYVETQSNSTLRRMTRLETQKKLAKAQHIDLTAVAGVFPEKHIWAESGKLIAVKIKGHWKLIT